MKKKKRHPRLTPCAKLGVPQVSGIRASRIRFEPANQVGPEMGRHKICRDCELGILLTVDRRVIDMSEFDVIL